MNFSDVKRGIEMAKKGNVKAKLFGRKKKNENERE